MTIGTVVGVIATGGWSPTAALSLAGKWGPDSVVLSFFRTLALRRALAAGVFALIGMIPFRDQLGSVLVPVVCGAVATAVGQLTLQILVGVAQGRGLARRANYLRSGVSVTFAAPIGVLAGFQFLTGLSVSVATVAWAWTASWALPLLACAVVLWRGRHMHASTPTAALRSRMKAYSRQSFLGSLSFHEILRADQLLAVVVLSTSELGQYVVASSFTGLLKALGQALGVSVLTAAAHSHDPATVSRRMKRSVAIIGAATVLAAVGLWPVFEWVLPNEFRPALPVSIVLVAASAVTAVRRVLVEYAKGSDRPLGSSAAEVAFIGVLVVAVVSGVLGHSMLGLAFATLGAASIALGVAGVSARAVRRSLPRDRAKRTPAI